MVCPLLCACHRTLPQKRSTRAIAAKAADLGHTTAATIRAAGHLKLSLTERPALANGGLDVPDNCTDRTRYFIVSPGRTGSTMLAWVMAKAGANFGLPVPQRWDPRAGEMEHPTLVAAARRLGASHQISGDKPRQLGRRMEWTWHRHVARKGLRRVLAEARFLKSEDLDLAVQSAVKLGYCPKIVTSFRQFDQQAASRMQRQNYASVDWLHAYYMRVCRNALVQTKLYGGCLVAYDDLMDAGHAGWADALAEVTGLCANALVTYRDEVLSHASSASERSVGAISLSAESDLVFDQMEALRNQAFVSSRQAAKATAEDTPS